MNEGAEKEKRRSDAERYSHGNDTYERRGEAELRRKFFAPLSFKKAGGRGETKFRIKFFAQLSFKKADGW